MDASAVLAVLNDEPGADLLASPDDRFIVSAVNLAEVVAKLTDDGIAPDAIDEMIDQLPLEVHAFGAEMAVVTGLLRTATRRFGLSLGDRACLALARGLDLPALTTDRAWRQLDLDVAVRLLR
ncbi:MAG TPA: type II toxin-antitoxin system VapC family toxin [Chloroflexota bacterium]|nr:type II toxin-antitoxin system VapC family toxin [Chloroflexota bacterium]